MIRFVDVCERYTDFDLSSSGIVNVMKGAGLGAGEAAYGALQLFLIVSFSSSLGKPNLTHHETAVNKEKTEDFIDRMLVELRQHYDRIQMLKDVYLTNKMKEYTAVLYRLGVEFLHESVRYYSMGTFRRLGYIIRKPPSIGVEKKVQEIKDAIRETEREMRALDGQKINDMKQDQHAMKIQQQEDREKLSEANRILKGKSFNFMHKSLYNLRTDCGTFDIQ